MIPSRPSAGTHVHCTITVQTNDECTADERKLRPPFAGHGVLSSVRQR